MTGVVEGEAADDFVAMFSVFLRDDFSVVSIVSLEALDTVQVLVVVDSGVVVLTLVGVLDLDLSVGG